jgi:AraC-like DNA-binding protein
MPARDDETVHRERPSRLPGAYVWSGNNGGATRILPDGCMDLIWRAGSVTIAGPDTRAHVVEGNDWTRAVGLRFAPGFGPRVLGIPASEFTDLRVPLDDVWSSRDTRLLIDRLAESDDPGAALEDLAFERARDGDTDSLLIDQVAVRAQHGDSVGSIATRVGLSSRQLQRRCAAAFGYGAKTLVRILRMTRALDLARSGTPLADTAATAGYADQAHLSREVKDLAGLTVGQLVVPAGSGAYRSTEWPSGS